jgi:hypothetical protein
VRRRPRADELDGRPLRLRRYDPSEWPKPDCHPECAFWQAQDDWRAEHLGDDDPWPIEGGPDAPWHPEQI